MNVNSLARTTSSSMHMHSVVHAFLQGAALQFEALSKHWVFSQAWPPVTLQLFSLLHDSWNSCLIHHHHQMKLCALDGLPLPLTPGVPGTLATLWLLAGSLWPSETMCKWWERVKPRGQQRLSQRDIAVHWLGSIIGLKPSKTIK